MQAMKNRIKKGPRAGLQIELEGENGRPGTSQLVIRIGIDTLKVAAENSETFFDPDRNGTKLRVTDALTFACEVARELEHEAEDGTTPVHAMFDGVIERAVEMGAQGCELIEPTDLGKFMKAYRERHPDYELPALERAYVRLERRRAAAQAKKNGG